METSQEKLEPSLRIPPVRSSNSNTFVRSDKENDDLFLIITTFADPN